MVVVVVIADRSRFFVGAAMSSTVSLNGAVNLAISKAMLTEREIANAFFDCFYGRR